MRWSGELQKILGSRYIFCSVEGEPYEAKIQEDSINCYKKFKINLKNLKNVDSIRTIKTV